MNERCFAMSARGKCATLIEGNCPGYARCAFYKPRWKHEHGIKAVYERLRQLPPYQQRSISDMYYKGKMPWESENE